MNHGAYDAYIHKRDRDFRQGRRKETKAKKKIKKGTIAVKRSYYATVSAMSRDLSGRTIRGCVTPSGTTKIKYQNEDDSFESFDGTNNNTMISKVTLRYNRLRFTVLLLRRNRVVYCAFSSSCFVISFSVYLYDTPK